MYLDCRSSVSSEGRVEQGGYDGDIELDLQYGYASLDIFYHQDTEADVEADAVKPALTFTSLYVHF